MNSSLNPSEHNLADTKMRATEVPAELSERISLLRLPLIIGVVFLHAYDPVIGKSIYLQYAGGTKFMANYISEGLATLSAPLLFLLAGYLFFYGVRPGPGWFSRKIVKRVKTLLVPLVSWNLICLLLTSVAQASPATAEYFSGRSTPIASFNALDYLNAIVGVTSHPIAYQLWFIRDLIVLAVLSPLIYLSLTTVPALYLVLLATRWFSASTAWTIPFLSREAMLFFSIGALLAIRRVDLRRLDKWAALALAYVPLSVLDALLKENNLSNPIHKIAELLGITLIICTTRYVLKWPILKQCLIALSPASFFVFACHEPLLTIVRKLSYAIWPVSSSVKLLALYFADPLLVTVLCIVMYFGVARTMPSFISVVTGGRIPPHIQQDACRLEPCRS